MTFFNKLCIGIVIVGTVATIIYAKATVPTIKQNNNKNKITLATLF